MSKDILVDISDEVKILDTPNLKSILSLQTVDVIKFINTLVNEASNLSASDILLEPRKGLINIRFRIDGVLYQAGKIEKSSYEKISSRIKVLCKFDITKKKKIQEGQFTVQHQ